MRNYIIRKVLTEEKIIKIKSILSEVEWYDGLKSSVGITKDIKNNLQCKNDEINSLVLDSIDHDYMFYNYTVPESSNGILISKMNVGGYYKTHTDIFHLGDFSTTIFFSDPDEYEGGELCLLVNNEEQMFKLNSGEAITYPTGTVHRVNEVKKGTRLVSVFWTTSLIKDDFVREIYTDILNLSQMLEKYDNSEDYNNVKTAYENPFFLTSQIKNKISRKYMKQ
jgi:PKHD-type hydroxylase